MFFDANQVQEAVGQYDSQPRAAWAAERTLLTLLVGFLLGRKSAQR